MGLQTKVNIEKQSCASNPTFNLYQTTFKILQLKLLKAVIVKLVEFNPERGITIKLDAKN